MLGGATRRGFFRFLPALPLAAKATADKAVADLARVDATGLGGSSNSPPICQPASQSMATPSAAEYRRALANPFTRAAVEDIVQEESRYVYGIDPDLAALRSFSLNAKIAFQRQRNVQRRLNELQNDYAYNRIAKTVMSAVQGFLIR